MSHGRTIYRYGCVVSDVAWLSCALTLNVGVWIGWLIGQVFYK